MFGAAVFCEEKGVTTGDGNKMLQQGDRFDVIVVGSGAAGLYACLCLPDHLRIALITKSELQTGASDWAQGGIAAALNPQDSPDFHYEDTLKAGAGLCDRRAVDFLVHHAPEAIAHLLALGVAFDRQGEQLAMTLEAAHSQPRVLHAADTTGRAIVSTLMNQVVQRPNIEIFAQTLVWDLWIAQGHCVGVSVLQGEQVIWVRGGAVVLATGGGGQVFAQTTNPSVSTGDGVALAWRAGAQIRDPEFCQFHPTALMLPGAPHFLISEAARGEGAHLIDAAGRRFVFDYHPAGELAPRDVVSRAIFHHLQRTQGDPVAGCVYLDLRPIPADRIRYRFPNIMAVCQRWGIDIFGDPIPVAPAAHYWMGGIAVDGRNQTSIPGLYAIGETASTGVHGANRLASNSLLECIVYADQFRHFEPPQGPALRMPAIRRPAIVPSEANVTKELQHRMWTDAGICREGQGLAQTLAWVQDQRQKQAPPTTEPVAGGHPCLRSWGETRNLLDVAYLILQSAILRTESRGGHYRSDFPHANTAWEKHTLITQEQWHYQQIMVQNG